MVPPPLPRGPRRGGAAIGALVGLALCAAVVAACGGDSAATPAVPTRVNIGPMDSVPRPSRDEAVAVPTWTLPPGAVAGSPGAVGRSATASPGTSSPGAGGQSGIPVPTAIAVAPPADGAAPEPDPAILALMAEVDGARIKADVERLAAFGTRHALSDARSPAHGIGAARAWLHGRFDQLAREGAPSGPMTTSRSQVLVELEGFPLEFGGQRTEQSNVVTTLTGISLRKRLVYAVAHYDSRSTNPTDGVAAAPGADDNASGVAMLLELVRVMSARQWDATLRFLALAAHETGTQGSRGHAQRAREVALPIEAVVDLDIVGAPRPESGPAAAVEAGGPAADASRRLARTIAAIGQRYGGMNVRIADGEPAEGHPGDHRRFADAGFVSARLREAAGASSVPHGAGDTPERVDREAVAEVARLGVAVLANLALAPPAPPEAPTATAVEGRGDAVRVSWSAVDDAAVSGYWLAVRPADSPLYADLVWVAGATDHTLEVVEGAVPLMFAVAPGDALGHIGLFSPEAEFRPGG